MDEQRMRMQVGDVTYTMTAANGYVAVYARSTSDPESSALPLGVIHDQAVPGILLLRARKA